MAQYMCEIFKENNIKITTNGTDSHIILIHTEKKSGAEVVLNTSYNLKDQTITRTPQQAIERFLDSDIDNLVIDKFIISKK